MKELKKELEFFESKKQEYLKSYKDKFVLIKGDKLIGVFDKVEDAYKKGIEEFGNTPFLIKQVREKEEPEQLPALAIGIISARI